MEEKLLLQDELNDYFTFVKKEKHLDTTFEIYCDDYGQSYVLAWKENGKVQEWCCGTYNDYEMEIEDIAYYTCIKKINRGEELDINTIETLARCFAIEEIEGEDHRWTRSMTTIINYFDSYYAIDWQKGLTEYQEDYFCEQPYKVEKKEKVITTHYYERIKE